MGIEIGAAWARLVARSRSIALIVWTFFYYAGTGHECRNLSTHGRLDRYWQFRHGGFNRQACTALSSRLLTTERWVEAVEGAPVFLCPSTRSQHEQTTFHPGSRSIRSFQRFRVCRIARESRRLEKRRNEERSKGRREERSEGREERKESQERREEVSVFSSR